MTDEQKPETDLKEEEKKTEKIADAKASENKTDDKEKKDEQLTKADEKKEEHKVQDVATDKQPAPKKSSELTDKKSASDSEPIEGGRVGKSEPKASDKKDEKEADVIKPSAGRGGGTKPHSKVKKEEAVINAKNLPISTKYSAAICKFIKGKKIEDAIKDLESVLVKKKAVPMKGEYAHKKGKGMMSGKYPKKATENFIKLLKSLTANANNHGIDEPVVVEAFANTGKRPFGRFGRVKRKRTHVRIRAKELKKKEKGK